jgi:hypothetical protein
VLKAASLHPSPSELEKITAELNYHNKPAVTYDECVAIAERIPKPGPASQPPPPQNNPQQQPKGTVLEFLIILHLFINANQIKSFIFKKKALTPEQKASKLNF